jgi:hypothetical protein
VLAAAAAGAAAGAAGANNNCLFWCCPFVCLAKTEIGCLAGEPESRPALELRRNGSVKEWRFALFARRTTRGSEPGAIERGEEDAAAAAAGGGVAKLTALTTRGTRDASGDPRSNRFVATRDLRSCRLSVCGQALGGKARRGGESLRR